MFSRKIMGKCGERLLEEVERLGGVSTVAKMLGAARNTVYNWVEKGNIPLNKLEDLAAFGGDTVYILTGQRQHMEPSAMTPRESAMLTDFRSASPEGQEAVEMTLKAVVRKCGPKAKPSKAA
ncbi:XRE family transcriptional regulator [Pandoraea anapnoica]|uniref:XRE family transcriptional regulator n=1 Tax=Pandoraea anapnoica TaxID=2508301 RepID=A0A5E5A2I0_9BURK|nr:helix-turn-helix domain-containing protein [Pandoraea anapnoica]VVE67829.1 XRE family transcriptional regulator [Pandoraea anapnoica]